jgi:hypothetical protein
LTARWVWWFLAGVGTATVVLAVVTYALYRAEDEPGGFWRSFAPNFYANLSAVGIAVALGIPGALAANRAWSRHQEEERATQARAQAVRALEPVKTEVLAIQARAQQIPLKLQSPGLTAALHPAQRLQMRLETGAWDQLKQANYLILAREYGLDAALAVFYAQAKALNTYVDDWGNISVRSGPEDLQRALDGATLICDNLAAHAGAIVVEIDEVLGRLSSSRSEGA